METATVHEKWRGVRIYVYPVSDDPGAFKVVFAPRFLQGERGPGGEPKRAERPAEVLVHVQQEAQVVRYTPPEIELPGIVRADYEQKALEEVRADVAGGMHGAELQTA